MILTPQDIVPYTIEDVVRSVETKTGKDMLLSFSRLDPHADVRVMQTHLGDELNNLAWLLCIQNSVFDDASAKQYIKRFDLFRVRDDKIGSLYVKPDKRNGETTEDMKSINAAIAGVVEPLMISPGPETSMEREFAMMMSLMGATKMFEHLYVAKFSERHGVPTPDNLPRFYFELDLGLRLIQQFSEEENETFFATENDPATGQRKPFAKRRIDEHFIRALDIPLPEHIEISFEDDDGRDSRYEVRDSQGNLLYAMRTIYASWVHIWKGENFEPDSIFWNDYLVAGRRVYEKYRSPFQTESLGKIDAQEDSLLMKTLVQLYQRIADVAEFQLGSDAYDYGGEHTIVYRLPKFIHFNEMFGSQPLHLSNVPGLAQLAEETHSLVSTVCGLPTPYGWGRVGEEIILGTK